MIKTTTTQTGKEVKKMIDFTDYIACIFGQNICGMSRIHAALNLIAYRMFVDLEY